MERMCDDLLGLILIKIENPGDRKSVSEVCKQWLRVEGTQRSSLLVFKSDRLLNFLPRFPNLLKFQASTEISNSHIHCLAKSCPKIQVLDLSYKHEGDFGREYLEIDDVDDGGLFNLASVCSDLRSVSLRKRGGIGDFGVVSLVGFCRNLRNLDLGWCWISDDVLESIGDLNYLQSLNLQACWLITDAGLASLAKPPLCNSLKHLSLAECGRITDKGLMHLREMRCLEELNLEKCGKDVTDIGGASIAAISTLKKLKLSWLYNLSDPTLVALARGCRQMEVLDLTGCDLVSGQGICAFSRNDSLKELVVLDTSISYTWTELIRVVLECSTLRRVVLNRTSMMWIPVAVQRKILERNCMLEWR